MTENPEMKPEPIEYIAHWAMYWAITERLLLGAPSGTIERSRANKLHEAAKGNLRHSLGLAERRAET